MMKKFWVNSLVLIFFLFGSFGIANGGLITSRTALGGNDYIDWGTLGPNLTPVNSPFTINSNSGQITATVSNPSGNFIKVNQQNDGWMGNFAPGDALLFADYNVGPINISFNSPIQGVGVQIQKNSTGNFTAELKIYGISNNLLYDYTLNGNSTNANDNSAIFLGALYDSPIISSISYSVSDVTNGFAINRMALVQVASVPIPAPIILLSTGLIGLLGIRRKLKYRS